MVRRMTRKLSCCLVREYAISRFVMAVAYIVVSPYGHVITAEVGSNLGPTLYVASGHR